MAFFLLLPYTYIGMEQIQGEVMDKKKTTIAVSIDTHLITFFNRIPRKGVKSRSDLINTYLLQFSSSYSGSIA